MYFLIPVIFLKIHTYNLYELSFPLPSEHIGRTVNIYRLFSHTSYSLKSNTGLIIFSKSFCTFSYFKFRCSCTDVISYCVLTNSAFNVVFHFSFDILRFIVISWWISDTDLLRTARGFIWKEFESASDKLHSPLYTFTVAGTSHIMWLSGFILCTLYSSAHSACVSM